MSEEDKTRTLGSNIYPRSDFLDELVIPES